MLTVKEIDSLQPKEKMYKKADGESLFLCVYPNGTKRWQLFFRLKGTQQTYSIGIYPTVSAKQARIEKTLAKELITKGIHPTEHRKQKTSKVDITFKTLLDEWLIKQSHLSKSSITKYTWVLSFVLDAFGDKNIDTITPKDVLSCLEAIQQKGKVNAAFTAKEKCSKIFNYAIAKGLINHNPTIGMEQHLIKRVPVKHRAAIIGDTELLRRYIKDLWVYNGSVTMVYYLRILSYLFTRPSELRLAKWADYNENEGLLSLYISKSQKDLIIPLPKQVITLLHELKNFTGHSEYIFQSHYGDSLRPLSATSAGRAITRMGYQKVMTLHGHRAVARTILDEEFMVDVKYIEAQLAHTDKSDTNKGAYNRSKYLTPREKILQQWADYLDSLRDG